MAIWPATAHELTQLQQALGELTPEPWQPPTTVLRIGACFVCFERVYGAGDASDRGFAGAAVTDRRRLLAGVSVSRAGLALHLGAVLGLPTVGITTRPLVAQGAWPVDQRGAMAPLLVGGEVVGC